MQHFFGGQLEKHLSRHVGGSDSSCRTEKATVRHQHARPYQAGGLRVAVLLRHDAAQDVAGGLAGHARRLLAAAAAERVRAGPAGQRLAARVAEVEAGRRGARGRAAGPAGIAEVTLATDPHESCGEDGAGHTCRGQR